jgi:hypothetical protein
VSPEPHWSPPTVSLQLNPLVRYWIGLSASPFAIHRGPLGMTSGLLDFITECSFYSSAALILVHPKVRNRSGWIGI